MTGSQREAINIMMMMESVTVNADLIAQVMGMDSTRLLGYARDRPELIAFPFQLSGNHMKIPRVPFLRWLGVTDEQMREKRLR